MRQRSKGRHRQGRRAMKRVKLGVSIHGATPIRAASPTAYYGCAATISRLAV
jgi:hypothetical protein